MRDGILNEIRAEYEVLRAKNEQEELRRRMEMMDKDPEIRRLFSVRENRFQHALREAFRDPESGERAAKAMQADMEKINHDIRVRLALHRLPDSYLQPIYECEICHDTGTVGDKIQERCACFTRRLRMHLYAQVGYGLNLQETFERYDGTVYPDTPLADLQSDTQRSYMARMRDRCLAYAKEYPDGAHKNLLMLGMSGLGKTFLMNCIGNQLLSDGREVQKLTAYQLSERMRASIFERNAEAFSPLLSVPVLLLDDLGVEPLINNVTIESLFTLLNERELHGLHTVISTNLTPQELKVRYTERVCSRLFSKKTTAMLLFRGKDVRLV